jgi:hypothetical protein
MRKSVYVAALLVLLVGVTTAAAQQAYTGTVMRVDPSAGVIVFNDGRMLQTTADSVIISGNQRMTFSALQSGTNVTVYSAQPVALRDGRYVLLSDTGARSAVVPPPPPPPTTAVVPAPSSTTIVTTPAPAVTTSRVSPLYEASGTVVQANEVERSIKLSDGRRVHLTDDTQVLLNGTQPVPLSTLKPGSYVVIRSLTPFAGSRTEVVPMREIARGKVVRVDQPGVLVLSNGQTIQTTPSTVVYVNNQPIALSTIQPGVPVIVYQDGSTVTIISNEPAASPALTPGAGIKEKEMDRQSK